jgi:hypothetical protein
VLCACSWIAQLPGSSDGMLMCTDRAVLKVAPFLSTTMSPDGAVAPSHFRPLPIQPPRKLGGWVLCQAAA